MAAAVDPRGGDQSSGPGKEAKRDLTHGHIAALDGIRGAAVAVVVVYHTLGAFFPTTSGFRGGFLGVDVFFVLSGFLVTSLLLAEHRRTGGIRIRKFYGRRVTRLLPALAVFSVVHLIYSESVGFSTSSELWSLSSVLSGSAYYLHVFPGGPINEGLAHLWSLSVEWHFYIVLPFLITLLAKLRRSIVVGFLALSILIVSEWRALSYSRGTSIIWLYIRTDTRADAVLAGVLLAFAWPTGRMVRSRLLGFVGWTGMMLVGLAIVKVHVADEFLYRCGFTVVALATAAVVASCLAGTGPVRVFENRALGALGRVSYGLYLWHAFVFVAVERWWGDAPTGLQVMAAASLTAALTMASWVLVENPLLRYARRNRGTPTNSA